MSKRKLPEIRLPEAPAAVDFAVHPQARAAFDPNVVAAAKDDRTITILDEIGENWDGTGVTTNRISAALRSIGPKPITVQINSPGGNFWDGLAIYNMLRQHPETVTVQVLGIAASAASIIAMAGDEIQIAKAGLMMIHNTQWIALGDRHVFIETAETMAVFDDLMAGLYVDRTGGVRADIVKMMDTETFMSGEDAVADGFADAFLPADKVTVTNQGGMPAHRKMAAALAKAGMPRAEIRQLMHELSGTMPSAASEDDMPGAVITPAMPSAGDEADGLSHLIAAAMKLKLARA